MRAMNHSCYFPVNKSPVCPFTVFLPFLSHHFACRICIPRVLRLPVMARDRNILSPSVGAFLPFLNTFDSRS